MLEKCRITLHNFLFLSFILNPLSNLFTEFSTEKTLQNLNLSGTTPKNVDNSVEKGDKFKGCPSLHTYFFSTLSSPKLLQFRNNF